MDSAEKIERGIKAKALLENEFFNECFDKLEAAYVAAWRQALTVELREDAHRYVTLIGWLKEHLKRIADTGKLEEKYQADLEGRRDPQKLSEFRR